MSNEYWIVRNNNDDTEQHTYSSFTTESAIPNQLIEAEWGDYVSMN